MLLIALAAIAATAQTPAAAIGDEQGDLRCLATFSYVLSEKKDETTQTQLQMGALYFAGKLFGRNPGIDLTAKMKQAITSFGAQVPIDAELKRCGTEMVTAGDRLMVTGNALQSK